MGLTAKDRPLGLSWVLAVTTFVSLLALPSQAGALSVKVTEVDHGAGEITVLLPAHNANLRACLLTPKEPEVRVREHEFYDAELVSGKIETTKRNLLRIWIPGERPAVFRILRVEFLSRP